MSVTKDTPALELAALGYALLLVKPGGKAPASPNGLKDATSNPVRIAKWPTSFNFGLLPGERTLVLDADSAAEADRLEAEYPELMIAPRCDTPGSGAHFYLQLPDGVAPPKTTVKVDGRKLDVRGLGKAYVLVPPSFTPQGAYTWRRPLVSPERLPVAPAELLALLTKGKDTRETSQAAQGAQDDRTRRYAQAALQAEYDAVVSAAEGQRNDALNRAAFSLGQLVAAGALDRHEVEDTLRGAARTCGLEHGETEATLKSGLAAGMQHPRDIPEAPGNRNGFSGGAERGQNEVDLLAYLRTDYGNAERLHALYGHKFKYCHALGFLVWDGKRWRVDEGPELTRLALLTARELFKQAGNESNAERRDVWVKHSLACERKRAIKDAIELAKSIPGVSVSVDELDADPMLLNVENGTLDLRTGTLKPHDPRDLITKLAAVTFDPAATCPLWREFQRTISKGDADLIAFKQRALGYTLTGKTTEDALFIAYGSGANGKSTEQDIVLEALGDYADTAQFESFAVRKSEGPRNDIAALAGARFVAASEGESRQRLAEGLVKQLTGGDVMKARFLNKEFFRFKPTFKLWLATNHKPVIRGTDTGIWRRIRLVPYAVTIPTEKRDKRLREKLQAELPGILNWLLKGCADWLEHGLGDADAVTKATEGYRKESDVLNEFLEACCTVGKGHRGAARDLYAAYKLFTEQSGEAPFNGTLFGRMLTERGYLAEKTGGKVYRLGITLKGKKATHSGFSSHKGPEDQDS